MKKYNFFVLNLLVYDNFIYCPFNVNPQNHLLDKLKLKIENAQIKKCGYLTPKF